MKKNVYGMIMILALLCGMMNVQIVDAASSGSKYINSKYGYLTGNVTGYKVGNEKCYYSSAKTTNKVSKIRAKMRVCYYSTGKAIGSGENSGWKYNSKSVATDTYYMMDFKNAETNKYDGFVRTKCTAYGTADAITEKSYVVYTNCTY